MIQYKYFPTVFVCVVDRFLSPVSQRIDCYKYPNSVLQTKKAVFFSNAHHAHHAHAHLTLVWGGNGQNGVAPPPIYYYLRGLGGLDLGMGKIDFDAVSDREKCKLSDALFGIKKYCS